MAEEHKVAEVHERTPHDVGDVRRALALLHPGKDQVVDDAAHEHLSDLRQSDKHGKLAGHSEASSPQGVISVHDGMYSVVHGHKPAATSHHVLVRVPRI